jgi:cytochrome bd-type quinol oxidase subunit 1
VVTGIVQEFQFGMNSSEYSRFVGDVFGAPLAIEGLAAFFLESTFLSLWIFGWDRLPRRLHLATIWVAAAGTWLSAYFILAANSFMQHPVGVRYNAERGRAELVSIWRLLTNNTALATFPHTVAGALVVAGTFVAAIATWWAVRAHRGGDLAVAQTFRSAIRLGLVALVIGGVAVVVSGDAQAKLMFQQQPMKMASAEALCHTETGAGFSLFAVGDIQNRCDVRQLTVPRLTSYLASGSFASTLKGVDELQAQYVARYGPGDYKPLLPVTYWSFRLMIGMGVVSAALALVRALDTVGLGGWLQAARRPVHPARGGHRLRGRAAAAAAGPGPAGRQPGAPAGRAGGAPRPRRGPCRHRRARRPRPPGPCRRGDGDPRRCGGQRRRPRADAGRRARAPRRTDVGPSRPSAQSVIPRVSSTTVMNR